MSKADEISARKLSTPFKAALLILIVAALLSGFYFAGKSGADPRAYGNDFNVYYFAAREVAAGRDPYQQSLGPWTPYLYPPLLAELLVPLSLLPLPAAAYVWFLISAASTVAASRMSAALVDDNFKRGDSGGKESIKATARYFTSPKLMICGGTLLILARFVMDNFNYGQVNTMVAALSVAHIYLYVKNRKAASAIALVLAISIKLTPAILIAYHITKRRVLFAVMCVLLLAAVTLLSFAPFGSTAPGAFSSFVNRTVKNRQGFDLAYSGNQSLRGALARIADNTDDARENVNDDSNTRPGNALTLALSIALLALSVFAATKARTEMAGVAPFFCLVLLISPLSWKAHYVMLILPIACLLGGLIYSQRGRRSALYVLALAATFILFNLTSPKIIGAAAGEWADAHSLVFAGAMLILIMTLTLAAPPRKSA